MGHIVGKEASLSYIVIPFDEKPSDEDLEKDEIMLKYMFRAHSFQTMESAKDSARFLVSIGAAQYCMIDLVISTIDEKTMLPEVIDEITVAEVEFILDEKEN